MLDRGAFISKRIIGDTPVRHYVLTFPPPLRYALAYNQELLAKIVSISVKAILSFLKRKAKKIFGLRYVDDAQPGAVSSIHRCSSNLDLNVHLHLIVTDGVFVRDLPGGSVSFHELPAPTDEEIAQIAWDICCRTTKLLRASGHWREAPLLPPLALETQPALAEFAGDSHASPERCFSPIRSMPAL